MVEMKTELSVALFMCFIIIAFTVIIIGVYTGWNFDIDKANSNYEIKQEMLFMEREHLLKLSGESKTTTDCQVLKNIRLEMLSSDSSYYDYLRNDIKEMAKERQEILCP